MSTFTGRWPTLIHTYIICIILTPIAPSIRLGSLTLTSTSTPRCVTPTPICRTCIMFIRIDGVAGCHSSDRNKTAERAAEHPQRQRDASLKPAFQRKSGLDQASAILPEPLPEKTAIVRLSGAKTRPFSRAQKATLSRRLDQGATDA